MSFPGRGAGSFGHPWTPDLVEIDRLTDEALIDRARRNPGPEAEACLEALYRRYHRKVAYWCLRTCGDREAAADLAQEVLLRVHAGLDSFRMESHFSTWLYQVARNVSINRGLADRRREAGSLDEETAVDPADPSPDAAEMLERGEILQRFRRAMEKDLDPIEAKILYLHHVDGMTLDGITALLGLRNRSGAKAYLVSGARKLRRRFGRWLEAQSGPAVGSRR